MDGCLSPESKEKKRSEFLRAEKKFSKTIPGIPVSVEELQNDFDMD